MYKYKCSKQECGTLWILQKGNINGFFLTCPVCGKGRGIFVEQMKNTQERPDSQGVEHMTVFVESNNAKTAEDVDKSITDFTRVHSLNVIDKKFESNGNGIKYEISYKLK